ncbi:hypothetical protein OROHE_010467 [Orobanche hederae]
MGMMDSAKILLAFIFIILSIAQNSDAQFKDYCVADVQATNETLRNATDWACGHGADCTAINQTGGTCFFPNTILDHASYAFNSYYQKMKNQNGSCYFNAAALLTAKDPSHGSCKFEFLP